VSKSWLDCGERCNCCSVAAIISFSLPADASTWSAARREASSLLVGPPMLSEPEEPVADDRERRSTW
jgi:hypothetical protein